MFAGMHRKILHTVVTSRSCELVLSGGDKNMSTNVAYFGKELVG